MSKFWSFLKSVASDPTVQKLAGVVALVAVHQFVKNPHSKEVANGIISEVNSATGSTFPGTLPQ